MQHVPLPPEQLSRWALAGLPQAALLEEGELLEAVELCNLRLHWLARLT